MKARHPEALEGVGGQCPATVYLGGESYDCADGSTFDAPRSAVAALADRYGVEVADIVDGEGADSTPTDVGETADSPADGGEDSGDGGVCGAEMSDGSTCERPADECPYHE